MDILKEELLRRRQTGKSSSVQRLSRNGSKNSARTRREKRGPKPSAGSSSSSNSNSNSNTVQRPIPPRNRAPNPKSPNPSPNCLLFQDPRQRENHRRTQPPKAGSNTPSLVLKAAGHPFRRGRRGEARSVEVCVKGRSFVVDDSDMTQGQTNDFWRDIVEIKRRQKSGISRDRKRKTMGYTGERNEDEDGGGGDESLSGDGASSSVEHDKDLKRMKANFEELCEVDKILVFFKRLLNEWKQELDEMSEAEKRTAKGKSMVTMFKQCAGYLSPLFKCYRKQF